MATQTTVLEIVAKGGPEAVAQFEKMAAATERFRATAEKALGETAKKAKDVPPALRLVNAASRELKDGADDLVRSLGPVGAVLRALGPGGVVAGVAVAGIGVVGAGLAVMGKRAIDTASQLRDQADAIGINVERLQELQFVAAQVGAKDALAPALQALGQRIGAIRDGQGALAKTLREVDPELARQAQTVATVDDAFTLAVRSISASEDAFTQSALAAAFFGKETGAKLLPVLRQGEAVLNDTVAEARRLGVVLSEELVNAGDAAGDRLGIMAEVIDKQLKGALLEAAPLIERITIALTEFLARSANVTKRIFEVGDAGKLDNLRFQLDAAKSVDVPDQERVASIEREIATLEKAIRTRERLAEKARIAGRIDAQNAAAAEVAARERSKAEEDAAAAAEAAAKAGVGAREQALTQLAALEDRAALAGLDAIAKVDEARRQSVRDWERLLNEGRITAEEFARAEVALTQQAEAEKTDIRAKEAEAAAREQRRLLDEQRRQIEAQQAELFEPFRNTIENIQRGIGDALYNAFRSGEGAAFDAAETIKDIFARLAAELAQLFLFRGIFVSGLAGAVGGVGGGASAGGGGLFGGLFSGVFGQVGTSVVGAGAQAAGLGNQSGVLGSALSLLGLGGTAAASAGVSLVPGAGIGGGTLVLSGGTAVGTLAGTGSAAFVGPTIPAGATMTAGTAAAGGVASLGAAAATAGIAAAVVGAIINTKGLIDAGDPARLRGGTLEGGTALAGAIPLVSAIQNFRYGHTAEGVVDLLLPTIGQAIRSIFQEGPSVRDFAFESVGQMLDQITRSRFFSPGTEAQTGGFRQATAGRAAIRADEDIDFLARLVARRLSNRSGFGPRGLSTDFRTLIEGGLARAENAGRDPFEVMARIVRQLLTFDQAVTQLNRTSLERGGSIALKPGLGQDEFLDRAEVLIRVYARELPAAMDAASVAAGTLARDMILTAEGIRREASRQSRARAEAEGTLVTRDEVERDTITRARRVRSNARRGGRSAQEDLAGFEDGLTQTADAVDALQRRLVLLANPAKVADQALGGVQVALDDIDAVVADPRRWDQLPDALAAAAEAVDALGTALTGMFDTLRGLTDEAGNRRLALQLELAALRGVTATAGFYNEALAEQQARFLRAESAAAKLAATDRIAELERAKAQAQIDELTSRAGLAASVEEQIQSIRFGQAQAQGTPASLAFMERAVADALRAFRTTTGDEQVAAGERLQALLQQQLELGGAVFGPGSARFGALQDQSLRTLEEIQAVIGSPEDIAADVKAIREALATRLEALGNVQQALIAEQIAALRTELGERFTPEEIEQAIADPTFAQLLVSREQLEILQALEARLIEVRQAIEASGERNAGRIPDPFTEGTAGTGGGGSGGRGGNAAPSSVTVNVTITGNVTWQDVAAGVEDGLRRAGVQPRVAA